VVYRGGLENRWAARSRGFESLPLRQIGLPIWRRREATSRRAAAAEEGYGAISARPISRAQPRPRARGGANPSRSWATQATRSGEHNGRQNGGLCGAKRQTRSGCEGGIWGDIGSSDIEGAAPTPRTRGSQSLPVVSCTADSIRRTQRTCIRTPGFDERSEMGHAQRECAAPAHRAANPSLSAILAKPKWRALRSKAADAQRLQRRDMGRYRLADIEGAAPTPRTRGSQSLPVVGYTGDSIRRTQRTSSESRGSTGAARWGTRSVNFFCLISGLATVNESKVDDRRHPIAP
jgi:hypothetical protein